MLWQLIVGHALVDNLVNPCVGPSWWALPRLGRQELSVELHGKAWFASMAQRILPHFHSKGHQL
jgi:hypothetical protein